MQMGMVGLGRMGANMTRRLMRGGHKLVVSDLSADAVKGLASEGATGSGSLEDLIGKLTPPRAVWIMVPAGGPTEATVQKLAAHLQAGDAIIDGGNSYFKDDVRRANQLKGKGIHYIDVGTSGGVWGLDRGYCMMIGGPDEAVKRLDPIFKTLAPGTGDIARTPGREKLPGTAEEGYIHCGPSGSGHFVKMVHNGIEYGIMQAYAEGFDIFKNATSKELPEDIRYDLNLPDIAEVWRRGERGQFVVARLDGDGSDGKSDALGIRRLRAGFRGGPLDDSGSARRSRAGGCIDGGVVCAFPFQADAYVRRENAFRDAPEIWRTRGSGHEEIKHRWSLVVGRPPKAGLLTTNY